MEPIYKNKIEELIYSELEDYKVFEGSEVKFDIKYSDNREYYKLNLVADGELVNQIEFKVDEWKIHVKMAEHEWYEIQTDHFSIKYFWMAVLSWNFL